MDGPGTESAAAFKQATQALVQGMQEQFVAAMAQVTRSVQASFAQLVGGQVKQLTDGFHQAASAVQAIDTNAHVVSTTLRQLPGDVRDFGTLVAKAGPDLLKIGQNALDSAKQVGSMAKELTQLPKTMGAIGEVTKAWKLAQEGVNVAFRSNPIGFVIQIVQRFLPLLIDLVQHNATVRAAVEKAFSIIQKIITTVMGIVEKVIVTAWPIISKVIQSAVTIIEKIIGVVFPAIKAIVEGVSSFIQAIVQKVWPAIVAIIKGAVELIRTVITVEFTIVKAVVETAWTVIKTIINVAVNAVIGIIKGIGAVFGIVKDAFGRAVTAVSDALGDVIHWVSGLPGRVLGALGDFGSTLFQAGKDLIMGLIRGIEGMAGQLLNTIKNFVLDHIPGPIKSILGISSPSKLMAGFGHNIGEGLAQGIEGSTGLVNAAMSKLVPIPRPSAATASMVGLAQSSLGGLGGRLATAGAGTAAAVSSSAGVSVNIYPQQGQSEYEIGRIAAREVAWAGKR